MSQVAVDDSSHTNTTFTHLAKAKKEDGPLKIVGFEPLAKRRKAADRNATFLIWLCLILALIPLIWVLATVIIKGAPAIAHFSWWNIGDLGFAPDDKGVGHAIAGTLLQVAMCTVISVPIGLAIAIYLVEYGQGKVLGRITTFMVDILSGVPSIVAALFIYTVWVSILRFDRSGFAVTLALILLMIPVIVRNTEEMLKVVPQDLREASYALGIPKWKTIIKIVLPTAASGIASGIMLAIARVMGESAPVIILVGSTRAFNYDLFHGPQSSLTLYMYDAFRVTPDYADSATLWGSALTLVILIAILNILARVIAKAIAPKTV